jgi:hypothetical protein
MANQANQFETMELVPRERRSRTGIVGWVLLLLVIGLAVAFVKFLYLPLQAEQARLSGQLGEASEREKQLKKKLSDADARVAELEAQGNSSRASSLKVRPSGKSSKPSSSACSPSSPPSSSRRSAPGT